jgi:hypothetical protein
MLILASGPMKGERKDGKGKWTAQLTGKTQFNLYLVKLKGKSSAMYDKHEPSSLPASSGRW